MKQLLLLPFLFLLSSAQAMDYIKCEAIQKAKERTSKSMGLTVSLSFDQSLPDIKRDICGIKPSDVFLQKYNNNSNPLKYSQDSLKWTTCISDNNKKIYSQAREILKLEPEYIKKKSIQEKIEADYKAEGCI